VVKVRGDDVDAGFVKEVEKASAVRAAAVTHQHASAFGNQIGRLKMAPEPLEHRANGGTSPPPVPVPTKLVRYQIGTGHGLGK